MARETKAQQAEKAEAIAKLRTMLKPGMTVHTILRHRSSSGMSRSISVVITGEDGEPFEIDYWVARACGDRIDQKRGGIVMGGCGMDMGFALVYNLSHVLFPDGFGCVGERCPSNDHSNGDRNYTAHTDLREHWHNAGGYALRHKWL